MSASKSILTDFLLLFCFITILTVNTYAATFTVTKTADTNDGVCNTDCSLREAVAIANTTAANDIINFDQSVFATAQTIILTGGELSLANNGSLVINGTGANLLTISGNNASRIFSVSTGVTATINGLTLTGGNGVGALNSGFGGAIGNLGTMTINNSIVSGNTANLNGGGISNMSGVIRVNNSLINSNAATTGNGGGIFTFKGFVNVTGSRLENNTANLSGGAIYRNNSNAPGDQGLLLTDSTINGNTANGVDGGGGIYIQDSSGQMNIINSIISNNRTNGGGGGIYGDLNTINVSNSTVSNNTAAGFDLGGGGIFALTLNMVNSTISGNTTNSVVRGGGGLSGRTITLTNSTVSSNSSANRGGGVYAIITNLNNATISNNSAAVIGGGISVNTNLAANGVNTHNSIIADNTAVTAPDIDGDVFSLGYNLIENTSGTNIMGNTTGNIIGLDPQLLPLAGNGGPTQTQALQATSPAIDAADPNNFLPTDQRGVSRPIDGDRNGTTLPDIGAFEAGAFIVTKTADTNDGTCDADCSLREAIVAANSFATNDSIVFSGLFNSSQTITLTGGELTIVNNGTLSLAGPGANLLTISANNLSRVFKVNSATANISGVKIADGRNIFDISGGETRGGGILNASGILTLNNVIISNNTALAFGGGVDNVAGTLALNNSIINNNAVAGFGLGGGGISNSGGSVIITNSIFSNNVSENQGGGILNVSGTMTISNSTINNNNAASGSGGGISGGGSSGGTLTINNSIINNNAAQIGGGINVGFTAINLNGVTISENTATSDGGGINGGGAMVTLTDSTVRGNTADSDGNGTGNGGGISTANNVGIIIDINKSTINNNSARNGAGIFNQSSTVNLLNATVANNTANENGGGIFKGDGQLNLLNATVSGNITVGGNGGGIYNASSSGACSARNTIIGDNVANNSAPDFFGTLISQGYNLIENISGTTISGTTTGNILGQDPQLLPLANYGGASETQALKPTSPAIDAADPNNFPGVDQRNAFRPADGDLNGTSLPDIGAYERFVSPFVVTKTADTNDGICDIDCSLREALATANAAAGSAPDLAVIFDAGVFSSPQVITLTGGELQINNNVILVIKGTAANTLTINGNMNSRVLSINMGAIVFVENIKITGGNLPDGQGGGIFNGGMLTLNNLTVSGNTAKAGGGIFNSSGNSLSMTNSTVANNVGGSTGGGGIYNGGGMVRINASTLRGNSAIGGGGIYTAGAGSTTIVTNSTINSNTGGSAGGGGIGNVGQGNVTTLMNSTISGNSADYGGGISNESGSILNLTNLTVANNSAIFGGGLDNRNTGIINSLSSIIAGNTASNAGPDISGTLTSQGYNLIGNNSGSTIIGTTTGNLLNVDPHLDPVLRNNGGNTRTLALRPNSPALDAADPLNYPTTDQRGLPRPIDGDGNGLARADIGAYERQTNDLVRNTLFDFDGDGRADISVFRPSNGTWYRLNSGSNNTFFSAQFGLAKDKIAPADFDGDGKTDLAVYRPSDNVWYLQQSTAGFTSLQFGKAKDIPAPADYDGDGKADVAVFQPSTGGWFVQASSQGAYVVQFGTSGDIPQASDFDGDGKADITVYRPSNGVWYRINSSDNQFVATQFGAAGDIPDAADFDGDGRTDYAVFRPSTGTWYLLQSANGFSAIQFGLSGDRPVAADFDGDSQADVAVFRPALGTWYIIGSTSGFMSVQFGQSGDIPAEYPSGR